MRILRQFVPAKPAHREHLPALAGMMGLYFLVVFAVGILRPIRNSLALDGLAATEFYKVYFVSSVVVGAVPLYNRLARRLQWKRLIPLVGAFFAANLLLLRLLYRPGSGTFGLVFYGWYELFAASLVTQVFLATQLTFDQKEARAAVPLIIIGGSVGATLGSFVTGSLAEVMGTPNLMFIAAACLGLFAVLVPSTWRARAPGRVDAPGQVGATVAEDPLPPGEGVLRHLRLVGALVWVTIVVKTLVDYVFNEAVAQHAAGLDATSSFLGYVLGATQWLPIVVLVPLRSLLIRWGLGLAVLILPVAMLLSTGALAVWFSVWTAVAAKACDTTFRYSAERTSREILYFPVPVEPKMRAKTFIDIGMEKGIGKVSAAVLIMLLLRWMDYRTIAWVAAAGCVGWIALGVRARRTYLRSLALALRDRYATTEGGFASLAEPGIRAGMSDALAGLGHEIHFGLDLLEEAGELDAKALSKELANLLDHGTPEVRRRVLRFLDHRPGLVSEERIRDSVAGRERSKQPD